MQRRKEFLIGSLIGLCVMLLALLAAVVAPRPRAALAQDAPRVVISIGESTLTQGDVTYAHASFHNMPQDPNDDAAFGNISFRYHFDRNSNGSWTDADNCLEDLVGEDLFITTWWRTPWGHGPSNLELTTTCPVGDYRLRVSVKDRRTNPHTQLVTATHDVRVNVGPSVEIEMPTGPYYRGTAINPTIKFKDLAQGANYTYEAWLMARNPPNYAEICEGTGLERDNTFTLNNVSGNPVQKSVTVTDACPKNEYTLNVRLRDSDDRLRGSKDVNFEIVTDSGASPSVSVSMSESSPVAPGTEFNVTFSFMDIPDGTAIRTTDYMTNTSTNQAVGSMDCGGSLVGWGQDVQGTINSNPHVNRMTIPSDCPVGAYKLESRIDNKSSGDLIIYGSIDFTIGDPNLIPSAPTVSSMTAKQNSPFSQQLPEGSGGDGTLSYDATGLPSGLTFTRSTRTIAGTPSGSGTFTVRYTVTDTDNDSDYVDFTITVDPDLTPTAPSVTGYTAKQNTLFSQQLPEGSGGDGTLTYDATGLPVGLTFIATTRTITGTPTGTGSSTVRYTVTDSDGDSAHVDFNITVEADLTPSLPAISGYNIRVGVQFTQQLPEATGGDTPLEYSVTGLPQGLSFTEATRTITGTPTTEEAPTVTYTVRDSDGDERSTTFAITVAADLMPTLSTISGYTARVGSLFSEVLPAATGGDTPLEYSATGLPQGLSFIESTRTITGTPTAEESPTVTYTVRDDDGDEASETFTIAVAADLTPSLTSITGFTAMVGTQFTQQLPEATSGDTPLEYTVAGLPAGLSFTESTRTITGTPTTVGSPTVTYTVRDDDGDEASKTFTIDVAADNMPAFSTISGYTARVGSPFTEVLPAATGGDTPLEYSVTGLPQGLSFIETTRTITGTPTTAEAPTVTYTVRDNDGDEGRTTFTITVVADQKPTLSTISGYTARVGSLFSEVLPEATGGDTPLEYSVTDLPNGLSFIETTRTITGTPTTEESPTVTYTVSDDDGDEASETFTIAVAADLTPSLSTISGYTARVDSPFSEVLPAATSGDAPLEYSVTDLPNGLSFTESTRTITGTPTTVESPTVTYTVRDDDGDEASKTFTIAVAADLQPTLATITDTHAKLTKVFTLQLPAGTSGDGDLEYNATGLPPGLTFVTSTRTITGTPTTANRYEVTYTATDEDEDVARQTFFIEAFAMPSLQAVQDFMATKDALFKLPLTAVSGGRAPFDYDATPLPTGLSFVESSLTITGTPTVIEDITVTFSVEDEDGDTASREFKITVSEGDTNPSFPYDIPDFDLRVGESFAVTLPSATGGNAPYTYTISGHPNTLTFNLATKRLAGTPNASQAGVHQVTYTVTDSDLDEVSQTFELDIAADNTPSEPSIGDMHMKVGGSLRAELPAGTGGDPPYTYTISALPSGLAFNRSTRILSGRPTAAGATTVTYTVYDEDSDSAAKNFTINVYALPSLANVSDSSGMKDELFTLSLPAASGGRPPLEYTVTGLPAGLDFIASSRVITGTPTQVEIANVTYTVSDKDNDQDSVTFKITVTDLDESVGNNNDQQNPPALTLFDSTGFSATVGEQFTQQLPAANGGTPPYRYSVTTLPDGLTFNSSTHTISGMPTTEGATVVTYTAYDDNSGSVSDQFTITVNAAQSNQPGNSGNSGTNPQSPQSLTVVDVTGYTATVGELFEQQLPFASGGSLPYAYRVTTLPAGLEFIMLRRTITGTPTTTGTTVITYTVTDSDFYSASDAFTITVQSAGSNQGRDDQGGGGNQGGGNQGGGNQGGGNSGSKSNSGNQGGGNSGSKSNSGNQGNSNNQQKYVPPSSYSPSQQQQWSQTPVPVAITTPILLNVRRGPGLDYEVITTVPEGTRANIYGRDPADDWFQVQIAGVDGMVWIYQDLTTVEGSIDGVRILEQWEIDLIPLPGDGPLAITTPAILNVRSGPGLDYDILTTVTKGTQATIIGIGPNSEWYKVNLGVLSEPAWIYAGLTTVTGSLASVKQYTQAEVDGLDTGADNPVAVTIPAILNVRSGPGTEYDVVTTVAQGTRAEIIGIGPQDDWFLVELDSLDDPAWIYQDLSTVVGSLAGVRRVANWQVGQPSSDSAAERPIAVTYPTLLNVREGPGETYNVLKAIGQGTRAWIMGISPDEDWYLVEIDGLDQLGWISENLTVLVGSMDDVKQITTEEIAMLPVAIANTAILNVRSGPGTGYSSVTTLSEGNWVEIVGVNAGSDWLKISVDGVTGAGWVYRELAYVAGPLSEVAEIAASGTSTTTQASAAQQPASTQQPTSTQQPAVSSINVEVSLPSNGNIELEVNWIDTDTCTELYKLYYRSNTDSSTYFSLETAVVASTASSKSLSFLTLAENSLISAWCGTHSAGRQVAEIQINPSVEGIYSSLPSQAEVDAVAAAPRVEQSN